MDTPSTAMLPGDGAVWDQPAGEPLIDRGKSGTPAWLNMPGTGEDGLTSPTLIWPAARFRQGRSALAGGSFRPWQF